MWHQRRNVIWTIVAALTLIAITAFIQGIIIVSCTNACVGIIVINVICTINGMAYVSITNNSSLTLSVAIVIALIILVTILITIFVGLVLSCLVAIFIIGVFFRYFTQLRGGSKVTQTRQVIPTVTAIIHVIILVKEGNVITAKYRVCFLMI